MKEPVHVETELQDLIEYEEKKIKGLRNSIAFHYGRIEGYKKAQETLDDLCTFYAKVLKQKDQEILGLKFQIAHQDEDYQKEINEWMNAPMGPYEDEDYTVTRGREVDEDGALISDDDRDPEYFVEDLADQEEK